MKFLKQFELWFLSKLFAFGLVIIQSFIKRERMSHDNGTTAIGKVTIVANPAFPAHEFFVPNKTFPCRLRLASVSYPDDAVVQVRGASIKFADSDVESPLDIELNTGSISLFWSARNFVEFANKRKRINELDFSTFYDKYPRGLIAAVDGLRKNPTSFTNLNYHSQCVQYFIGNDNITRYCKFKLTPFETVPESGIVSPSFMTERWKEIVEPGEKLDANYLKKEFKERITKAPVKFKLQIQIHTPVKGESDEIFNCNVEWDEKMHPFLDVAVVEVNKLLSLDENNQMIFSISACPKSLGIIPAYSVDDYNSVNYMRTQAGMAKKTRLLAYKIFGNPKPVHDKR